MNTRISAIATNVYVLVTVMPRYSRSILSSILQGKPPLRGEGERGLHRERYAIPGSGGHSFRCTVKLIPP
jgi:hypothetical protein